MRCRKITQGRLYGCPNSRIVGAWDKKREGCLYPSKYGTSPVVMMDALNIHGGEKLDRAMLRCVVVTMHIVYFYECY